jgi:2-(1,2-epoxy-1,2-dihydrophenyl)acetyl-CoA isomerase
MNRPEVLNALNMALIVDLDEAVQRAAEDENVKVVVLTGAGRGFCSGGDVRGVEAPADGRARAPQERSAPRLLHDMGKPTIAMINGPVAGAGVGLAGACDLRIAAESATFYVAFARWGLTGDYGSTYFWPKIIGAGKARELFVMNEKLDAHDAMAAGVFTRVYPDAELKLRVDELATRLVRTSAQGWAGMKDSLNGAEHLEIGDAFERESRNMGEAARARAQRRAVDDKV